MLTMALNEQASQSQSLVCRIPLTKGYFCLVDECDMAFVSQWKWKALFTKGANTPYAVGKITDSSGKSRLAYMARLIMGEPAGMLVDHKNGNTLDNRRRNLRVVTHSQNSQNQSISTRNKSGHKGVHWNKLERRWKAAITVNKKVIFLGGFQSLEAASLAYRAASKRWHGEFARVSE